MPGANFAGGRLAPGLRFASHNTDGLRDRPRLSPQNRFPGLSKLHALMKTWHHLNAHIICLQETHLHTIDILTHEQIELLLQSAPDEWGLPKFTPFWGSNTEKSSAGVAILIRTSLLENGSLKAHSPHADTDGRLLHIKVEWGGHKIRLINAYLPSSDPKGQKDFITSRLTPLLQSLDPLEQPILLGDFNFTDDWSRDRCPPPSLSQQPSTHRDVPPAREMARLGTTHHLLDTFRALHPSNTLPKHFTYLVSGIPTSRLDRIYTSTDLLPFIHSSNTSLDPGPSDHRPITTHLRPRCLPATTAPRPPRPRVRMTFSSDPNLMSQFLQWLEQCTQTAPIADDAGLIRWWSSFKVATRSAIKGFNKQLTAGRVTPTARDRAASKALAEARDALMSSPAPATLLPRVLAAQREKRAALVATSIGPERAARLAWLRAGEHASPLISKLISPPRGSNDIAAVRCSKGTGLVNDSSLMAQEMADFFASVSCAPPRDTQAEEAVLAAIKLHSKPLSVAQAESAGRREVTSKEVISAISSTAPGKASGPDGLPVELWRKCKGELAPLLAKVYSAIGRLGIVPQGFLAGELNPFHKKGDRTDPAMYRPITLLNTDYRILAKILAQRLAPIMASVVGPEQAAFIPGRLMGDNIIFMQLLPHLLRSNAAHPHPGLASNAVVAFLDFKKAYDTVLRPFLYKVMEARGVGEGLIHWVMTLLSDTCTAAVVNGHPSKAARYEAGLRQGCPLAPILYIFVAEALACWLKECPAVGVEVTPGNLIHCLQYADDAWALIKDLSPTSMQQFLESMHVFSSASNQHLNISKTELLPVGDTPVSTAPPLPPSLKVTKAATSLGTVFDNGTLPAPPARPWEELKEIVRTRYTKIAKMPLSIWGRAAAAHTYALSQLLFQAEFNDVPPELVTELQSWTTLLVDRQAPPPRPKTPRPSPGEVHSHLENEGGEGEGVRAGSAPPTLQSPRLRPPGVPSTLLVGKASQGGFGVLPWSEHITARHATWGSRAIQWMTACPCTPPKTRGIPLTQPLWIPLVSTILTRMHPNAHPALTLLRASHDKRPPSGPPIRPPIGPLARMEQGLRALGPTRDVASSTAVPPAAAWCSSVPLWNNPALPLPLLNTPSHPLAILATLPLLRTTGDLAQLRHNLHSRQRLDPGSPHRNILRNAVEFLWLCIPIAWRNAIPTPTAPANLPASPMWGLTPRMMVGRLGWHQAGTKARLLHLNVQQATRAQVQNIQLNRNNALLRHISTATPPPSQQPADTLKNLKSNLAAIWKIQWEPRNKETFWRLINNGISGAGGHDSASTQPCPCGWTPPVREGGMAGKVRAADTLRIHAFWDCPIAKAVINEIDHAAATGDAIQRYHIWLASPPQTRHPVDPSVWHVVSLAALTAMDHGRKTMYAMLKDVPSGPERRQQRPHHQNVPTLPPHVRAARAATARFWCLLQDYADIGGGASPPLPPGHPFFTMKGSYITLHLPYPDRLPADLDPVF